MHTLELTSSYFRSSIVAHVDLGDNTCAHNIPCYQVPNCWVLGLVVATAAAVVDYATPDGGLPAVEVHPAVASRRGAQTDLAETAG